MENLWATLARGVEKVQCETMEAQQAAVEAEWNMYNIDGEHLQNLVRSMPERCDAVILANGSHTKY